MMVARQFPAKNQHRYYQKPIDSHPYLHWTSAYPPHLKHSILYSQALRLRRLICSNEILEKKIEYSKFFVASGYDQQNVRKHMEKVLDLTQEQCLKIREKPTTNPIPLVTIYSPYIAYSAEIENRNWNFLKSKKRLTAIFTERPLISYRRPINLIDKLVHTKFRSQNEPETEDFGGKACKKTRYSWCNSVKITSRFQDANNKHTYKILHNLNKLPAILGNTPG